MIAVHQLHFRYPGASADAVENISFEIPAGEIFGFLGPSGAGKSTTQKILTGLLKNFTGEVVIRNRSLHQWGADYYNHIGVGFELPNHYLKLTAMENLAFFSSFYPGRQDPEPLLKRVGLWPDARRKVEHYSKGMKVRLNFVRALMHDPEILFLDEPTSGLDPVNARILKDIILEERKRGKTIFITTHNMHDADELCDRISFMVDGGLKITDSPANLKRIHGKHTVSVEYSEGSQSVAETFPLGGLGSNRDFLQVLETRNILSIHSQEATLDEVFIMVTGKSLQ